MAYGCGTCQRRCIASRHARRSAYFLPPGRCDRWFSGTRRNSHEEGPIRTFGVGLMAIAAVAAGLVLSRARTSRVEVRPVAGETLPSSLSLEALRAAGM